MIMITPKCDTMNCEAVVHTHSSLFTLLHWVFCEDIVHAFADLPLDIVVYITFSSVAEW